MCPCELHDLSLAADESCKDRLVCLHVLPGCHDRLDYSASSLIGPTSGWLGCNKSYGTFLIERVTAAVSESVILTCEECVFRECILDLTVAQDVEDGDLGLQTRYIVNRNLDRSSRAESSLQLILTQCGITGVCI
ncbi:hypothetical protein JG687_00008853 [Phytophthora cactorum]|uniref:Uncharacterized protein n=1 Tax=Phytophthora cactorum TaxID=29920 RepID=A0A8T1UCS9_9STRA|nr:hypothetical protein JG687_00008853 [Phytophthora cactorum]